MKLKKAKLGDDCMAKICNDMYPGIYIGKIKNRHLIYVFHLDKIIRRKQVYQNEYACPLLQTGYETPFGQMESPSYLDRKSVV